MKEICLTSPTHSGGSRSNPIFASPEELEYAKRMILERRRLEQPKTKHELTNPSITDPNSQTPTNQGKIKEEITNDIDSVIRRAPFPSLLRAVEGNETQSNKDDAGRDEYHRSGHTAEQETPRSPRNERGTPQNEYGTMECSPGATVPSIALRASYYPGCGKPAFCCTRVSPRRFARKLNFQTGKTSEMRVE